MGKVSVKCKSCDAIDTVCADERVPRTLGIEVFQNDDGTLDYEYVPEYYDEAYWEDSETVGFICEACAFQVGRLEDIAEVLEYREWRPGDRTSLVRSVKPTTLMAEEGTPVEVLRRLGPDEADEEVGPMYRVRTLDGPEREFDVFADELNEENA